jgi:uroporphyrin-III C-methyltransferase
LLTVAAARFLSDPAALVISDRLVSAEVLALVRGELRIAGKLPGCAEAAQQEIYGWVAEAVAGGRDVVRLKIGDPFVFGRGGEEARKLSFPPIVLLTYAGCGAVLSHPSPALGRDIGGGPRCCSSAKVWA